MSNTSATFQAGRIYRTANGELMKLEAQTVFPRRSAFVGTQQTLHDGAWMLLYHLDGNPMNDTKAEWRLLPGALDPRQIHYKPPAKDHKPVHGGWPNAYEEEQARQDTKRLDALEREKAFADQNNALRDSAMADIVRQLRNIRTRLTAIEKKKPELVRNHPDLPECGNAGCGQCYEQDPQKPGKRPIKGGWVNVYARGNLTDYRLAPQVMSKERADYWAAQDHFPRIACIQIPDFNEGDGL